MYYFYQLSKILSVKVSALSPFYFAIFAAVFFNEVAGLQPCNFIKKRLQHRCFHCETCEHYEIFKNAYLEEHLRMAASVRY